jgi:hypothetical protein
MNLASKDTSFIVLPGDGMDHNPYSSPQPFEWPASAVSSVE